MTSTTFAIVCGIATIVFGCLSAYTFKMGKCDKMSRTESLSFFGLSLAFDVVWLCWAAIGVHTYMNAA